MTSLLEGGFNISELSETIKSDNWKTEKHVPSIEVLDQKNTDDIFEVRVAVGQEIQHPNTTEHYIPWIKLFFLADEGAFPVEIDSFQFSSPSSADNDAVVSSPSLTTRVSIEKSGTLMALSYCNLHGLWQNEHRIELN